jgi:hypothetical protein
MAQLPFNSCGGIRENIYCLSLVLTGEKKLKIKPQKTMTNELQISPTYFSMHGSFLHSKIMPAYAIICACSNGRRSSTHHWQKF